jgi:N-acetyl-alpha-D-muramate 1-phosphate uridylyltransferase
MSHPMPKTAMLLAAGLGTRMRPLTERTPKPLIKVGGKALIDWSLDQLAAADIQTAVVNVHHLAPRLITHLKSRAKPAVVISDETDRLLDTGGGITKALPLLGPEPFFVFGCDTVTLDGKNPALRRLADEWSGDELDVLMLVHPLETACGFDGPGDFFLNSVGHLSRRGDAAHAPYVYTGIQIVHPRAFKNEMANPFSMNKIWDRAIAARRMKAIVHDGAWFHVGTPDAVDNTDAALRAR